MKTKKPKFIQLKNKTIKVDNLRNELVIYFLDEQKNDVVRVTTIKFETLFRVFANNYKPEKKA